MTYLGTIELRSPASIQEARKKVRLVAVSVLRNIINATRVATATSEIARKMLRETEGGRIDLSLEERHRQPCLVIRFIGDRGLLGTDGMERFFDEMVDSHDQDKKKLSIVGYVVTSDLRWTSDEEIESLRRVVAEKGRDELISEVQTKNLELQESLDHLRRTRSAKERMESELNIGRDIQMSMVPVTFPPFPDRHEFSIFATLRPAREVGGDFYDFFFIDDDRLCFCIGDVSGKGVPSALFMAVTKTLLSSGAKNDSSPASVLTHVNDELCKNNESCMFVTLFFAILDVRTGELWYTNAGHNPPYFKRASGEIQRMDALHGPVLGAAEGMAYGEGEDRLSAGDLLLMYTDGVTEAMDTERNLFTENRLVEVLSAEAVESVEKAVDATVVAVKRFESGSEQADDITVLALQLSSQPSDLETIRLECTICNRLEELARVSEEIDAFAERNQIGDDVRRKVNLVLDELLNNVVIYAFPDGAEHEIHLVIDLSGSRLALRITDDGVPFNPFGTTAPDTNLSVEEREIGGLGIHLVRNIMDEFDYERHVNQNVVTLVKHLSTQPRETQ